MPDKETQFSGLKELTHVVQKGETLSGIAAAYRERGWPVRGWEPIYDLTRVRTGLWERTGPRKQRYNPDLIYPGDVLILPRSLAGYDLRIGQLVKLGEAVFAIDGEAAKIRRQAEGFGKRLDLLSSVLQLVATCGFSAVTAVKATRAARGLTGAKLAEQLAAKKEALTEIGVEAGKLAVSQAASAHSDGAGYAATGALYTTPKLIDTVRDKALKAAKGVKAVGWGLARGADMILDYVTPSFLAKLWIYQTTGEHVDDVLVRAELREIDSRARTLKMLGDRAAALRAEKAFLYEGGPEPERGA